MKIVKFQMMMSPEEVAEYEEYRWTHRLRSRAEAIRVLAKKGLEASAKTEASEASAGQSV